MRKIIPFLISAGVTFLLIQIAICLLFLFKGYSFSDYGKYALRIIVNFSSKWLFWAILILPYFIVNLLKNWLKCLCQPNTTYKVWRIVLSVLAPTGLTILFVNMAFWYRSSENFKYRWDDAAYNPTTHSQDFLKHDNKIRAIHVFGLETLEKSELNVLVKGNIEQMVVVPYAYQEDYDSPELDLILERQDKIIKKTIEACTTFGIQVIIKPHIWLSNSDERIWRDQIAMRTVKEWELWEGYYSKFILHFAQLSEKYKLPLFCVGTELHTAAVSRPGYWIELIRKVRKEYSGPLTYGANWNREYLEIPFWCELDYIGIQAYFPLAKQNNPNLAVLQNGWTKHIDQLRELSNTFQKQVIFTEIGYKSTADAAQYPWKWESTLKSYFSRGSNETQANCYRAFFDCVWDQDWFGGALFWRWDTEESTGFDQTYSPKNKPAYNEIAKGFTCLESP